MSDFCGGTVLQEVLGRNYSWQCCSLRELRSACVTHAVAYCCRVWRTLFMKLIVLPLISEELLAVFRLLFWPAFCRWTLMWSNERQILILCAFLYITNDMFVVFCALVLSDKPKNARQWNIFYLFAFFGFPHTINTLECTDMEHIKLSVRLYQGQFFFQRQLVVEFVVSRSKWSWECSRNWRVPLNSKPSRFLTLLLTTEFI